MRFTRRSWGLVAAAVTVGAVVPIAWSSTADARQGHPTVITLHWKFALTTHDLPPTGPSSGDTLQAHYALTGQKPGSADFTCTAVGANYVCQGIIRLHDGDLYAQVGPLDETQPAAIVGGTRAYDGARGQFTQVELPHDGGTWA